MDFDELEVEGGDVSLYFDPVPRGHVLFKDTGEIGEVVDVGTLHYWVRVPLTEVYGADRVVEIERGDPNVMAMRPCWPLMDRPLTAAGADPEGPDPRSQPNPITGGK